MTAAELMAQLEADPEWVARRAKRDEEFAIAEAELQRAEEPLVRDLRSAGCSVGTVWDLVNTPGSYSNLKVVPILFAHLEREYPPEIRDGIARALAVPAARIGWSTLTRMYVDEQNQRAKDGLAVAVAGASDLGVLDDVISLAKDTRNGSSRGLLLNALERWSSVDPRARTALMALGTDAELAKEVPVILRRLNRKARGEIPLDDFEDSDEDDSVDVE